MVIQLNQRYEMKIALITYVYPKSLKFIPLFLKSIQNQTVSNFTICVFNDNVPNIETYFNNISQNIMYIDVAGTPTEIRFTSLKYLANSSFDSIVFQDIDDEMSDNRIEISSNLLKKYNLVTNDLTLINSEGKIIEKSIWSTQIVNLHVFDYNFIKNKNIVGLGNTAIKREILNHELKFSKTPIAADWFIFYQLLIGNMVEGVFTNECQTLYRQHDENIAGVKNIDLNRLFYTVSIKKAHFEGLKEIGFDVEKEINELDLVEKKISMSYKLKPIVNQPLWWSETEYLI